MNIWGPVLTFLNISSPVEVATECVVCGSNLVKLPTEACTHAPQVCMQCLQQVILAVIDSGDLTAGIRCPSLDCPHRLGYYDVQKWATEEVFEKYDKLLLQDSLRTSGSYVSCAAPNCKALQEHMGGEDNVIVTCHHCGTKQCFRHQVLWHEGLTCDQWDAQQRAITDQHEQKTEEWIQAGTKACPGPGCGRRIQKTEGCDHLICKRPGGCGHQFCWECLAPWLQIISEDNSRHYDSCKYYSGLPGKNPAPPEIVAARTVLAPPLPSTPSNPTLREARTSLFYRPQPLHEPVLAHLAQRRELLAGRIRATSRTAEVTIQASTPPTTLNATPSSSSTEPSGSSRMPIVPTISEPSSSSSLPTHNSNLISHGELFVANNTQRVRSNVYSPNIRRRDTAVNREISERPVPQRLDGTSFPTDPRNWDMRQRVERRRAEWQANNMRSGSGPGPRTSAYIEQASHWHRHD